MTDSDNNIIKISEEDIDRASDEQANSSMQQNVVVLRPDDLDIVASSPASADLLTISLEELVVPLAVSQPSDGAELASSAIDIIGKTVAGTMLELFVNGASVAVSASNPEGIFKFQKIPLNSGDNELTVTRVGNTTEMDERVSLRVKLRILPYLGLADWFTQEALTPDRDIVRCRKCHAYLLRETWNAEGCFSGHKGNSFYTPDQPEFHTGHDRVLQL